MTNHEHTGIEQFRLIQKNAWSRVWKRAAKNWRADAIGWLDCTINERDEARRIAREMYNTNYDEPWHEGYRAGLDARAEIIERLEHERDKLRTELARLRERMPEAIEELDVIDWFKGEGTS